MTPLEHEIARVAALRGKPALNYLTRAPRAVPVHPQTIANIFSGNPDWRSDISFYDDCPEDVRLFIRECSLQLNAATIYGTLEQCPGGGADLISLLEAHVPTRVKSWILRHYGPSHPSVRRLP
jgi:hypothetical protein